MPARIRQCKRSRGVEGYRGDVRFARVDAQIRATWEEDAPISMERDEREEVGRRAVLGIVCDVCALPLEIKSDWFAVGTHG